MSEADVSVVVLTCNRKSRLLENLSRLAAQSLRESEVIVVDNGSTDGSCEEARKLFPGVRLIRLPGNKGCEGRNAGIRAARAPIVVTLDDDVYFKDNRALERLLDRFKAGDVDAMCFKIWDYSGRALAYNNWYHPREIRLSADLEFETDYISEGAVAFRRDVFEETGYYPGDFFLGHEGYDLALRIINAGYRIVYCPSVEVVHAHSAIQRESSRDPYHHTRNLIWLFVRNYPVQMMLRVLPFKLLAAFVLRCSQGEARSYLTGLWDGVRGVGRQRRFRAPLSPRAIRRLKAIRSHRPGARSRLREFLLKNRLRAVLRKKPE